MKARRPIGSMSVQCAVKLLTRDGYAVTAAELFGWLRSWGWVSGIRATAAAKANGFLTEQEGTYYRGRWRIDVYVRVFVTGHGIDEIKRRIAARQRKPIENVIHNPALVLGC